MGKENIILNEWQADKIDSFAVDDIYIIISFMRRGCKVDAQLTTWFIPATYLGWKSGILHA